VLIFNNLLSFLGGRSFGIGFHTLWASWALSNDLTSTTRRSGMPSLWTLMILLFLCLLRSTLSFWSRFLRCRFDFGRHPLFPCQYANTDDAGRDGRWRSGSWSMIRQWTIENTPGCALGGYSAAATLPHGFRRHRECLPWSLDSCNSCVFHFGHILEGPQEFLFTPLGLRSSFSMAGLICALADVDAVIIGLLPGRATTASRSPRQPVTRPSHGFERGFEWGGVARAMSVCSLMLLKPRQIVPVVAVIVITLGVVMLTVVAATLPGH